LAIEYGPAFSAKEGTSKPAIGTTGIIRDYTAGTLAGIVGKGIYNWAELAIPNVDLAGKIYRGLAGVIPGGLLFTGAYLGADKLIKHGPIKMWSEVGKNYWKTFRDTTLYLGWLVGLTINGYIIGAPTSLVGRIAKTLLLNPLMLAPWLTWYRTTSYIVDKYGTKELFKSFFNFKIFKYLKEAYQKDLKPKLLTTIGESFLTLAPIHFYTMNFIQTPVYRLAIGTGNDVLLSMIAGEEGLLSTAKRKFSPAYQRVKSYFTPKLGYIPKHA